MAHEIQILENGDACYVESGFEPAWHGLGKRFGRRMTVMEALEWSHANYIVEARPVIPIFSDMSFFEGINLNGDELESLAIKNVKATIRTDTKKVLGIVSDKYEIVNNGEGFSFIDMLCSGRETDRKDTPVIDCSGVLYEGRSVFVTCVFPEPVIINSKTDDRIYMYAVFTNSHDGKGAVKCMITPIRVCCSNTLNFALRNNSGKISFKHTANISSRMDLLNKENAKHVYQTLGLEKTYREYFEAELERLRCRKLTEEEVMKIVANVVLPEESFKVFEAVKKIDHDDIATKSQNKFNAVMDSLYNGIGQDILEKDNALWLMNGITTHYQNAETYKSKEVKFESIMGGNVYNKVQKALSLVTA